MIAMSIHGFKIGVGQIHGGKVHHWLLAMVCKLNFHIKAINLVLESNIKREFWPLSYV